MKTIESIKIEQVPDYDADLSYLGEYTDEWSENAIDRKPDDRYGRYARAGEYRYFVPAMTGEETGNPESPVQDYERAEAYNRGEWSMVGVRAVAIIRVNGIRQEISTAGLWGVESDSDKSYFDEIGREELETLREMLAELCFSKTAIAKATSRKAVKSC